MSICATNVSDQGEVTRQQAEDILQRIRNMAEIRSRTMGIPIQDAVDQVTAVLQAHDEMSAAIQERNHYLNIRARAAFKDVAERAKTIGEGIMSFLEGGKRVFAGARNSVDYQIRSNNAKYFGRLVADLEQAGVLREFRTNALSREVYQEMGELREGGKPGISGSEPAQKIAKIIDDMTKEMVARQNRAGAYIGNIPGYVARQTHDMRAIRDAGRTSDGQLSKHQSYLAWRDFSLPLIDQERTFLGADQELFMRNVHDGIYTGIHGAPSDVNSSGSWRGSAGADRASRERVLHFKDADSAWQYNQKFGIRDLREQVISDIHNRARAIGLMENLGPDPADTLQRGIRELKEQARTLDDAAQQIDSVNDAKVQASYNQLTGVNQIPANPTMARIGGNVRVLAQLAKMGASFISVLSDRAFFQAEMAYQGISNLTTLGKQVTSFALRTGEQKRALRLMGVAMDGLMGNALSRYSDYGPVSGVINAAQRKFFDINFHNYWTDSSKAAAAELMAAHLGEHAHLGWNDLPKDINRTLSLYMGADDWAKLRTLAYRHEGQMWITPDRVQSLDLNLRDRDALESKLRTYLADRVDMAIPTPGAAERRLTTMDTRVGTGLGEAVRLLMLFKSFPMTIMHKVLMRDIYGRGANTVGEWLMNDHQGKFNMTMMIAMATGIGYISNTIRDALNGKTPQELISDGKINYDVLTRAARQGGGLGLFGEMMTQDYERHSASFLEEASGPVLGQLDTAARILTGAKHGENVTKQIGKMTIDNVPLINLFYVRPVLNYYVLWNLEQMMDTNRIRKMRQAAEDRHQDFFWGPAAR